MSCATWDGHLASHPFSPPLLTVVRKAGWAAGTLSLKGLSRHKITPKGARGPQRPLQPEDHHGWEVAKHQVPTRTGPEMPTAGPPEKDPQPGAPKRLRLVPPAPGRPWREGGRGRRLGASQRGWLLCLRP